MRTNKDALYAGLLKDIKSGIQEGVVADFNILDLVSAPTGEAQQRSFLVESTPALRRLFEHFAQKSFIQVTGTSLSSETKIAGMNASPLRSY